jgi:hypothetical protein
VVAIPRAEESSLFEDVIKHQPDSSHFVIETAIVKLESINSQVAVKSWQKWFKQVTQYCRRPINSLNLSGIRKNYLKRGCSNLQKKAIKFIAMIIVGSLPSASDKILTNILLLRLSPHM